MLNLRLVRSPLDSAANETILKDYNRLTGARIPIEEFVHWVQDSPAGPAWHGLLETDDGRIVGHTSLFPFRTVSNDGRWTPAKSEFSVLHEDFRGVKIRGYEKAARPAFIILLDQVFKQGLAEGWGPIFASTNEKNQVFTRKVGLRPVELPLWECLMILKPAAAARETPNLVSRQRAALFVAGLGQQVVSLPSRLIPKTGEIHCLPVKSHAVAPDRQRLSFFEDQPSLSWRYLDGQYVRFGFDSAPEDYVIAKRGSKDRYLRVLQWRLESLRSVRPLLLALIHQARSDRALGLRWAVYDNTTRSQELVQGMRSVGFLCARRTRIMMVHVQHPEFVSPAAWNMNDSLFSFDP